jgi:hypothetical protein
MEFCGCVDYHSISLVQEVFEQDERAKVCRGANDAEDNCEPIGRRYKDSWQFHFYF